MRTFTVNVPSLPILVRKKYLNPDLDGFERAYLISVTGVAGRPLFFGVHLESCALYTRLPITALVCTRYTDGSLPLSYSPLSLQDSQPWSCLAGDVQYICLDHLKGARTLVKARNGTTMYGNYLFSIDYDGDGLTEDPEQYKSHNVIALKDGSLVAYPNNYLLFLDEYFVDNKDDKFPNYKRQSKYWMPGG